MDGWESVKRGLWGLPVYCLTRAFWERKTLQQMHPVWPEIGSIVLQGLVFTIVYFGLMRVTAGSKTSKMG